MNNDARAFWVAAPGRGEIRAEALPPPSADDVVVRALYSGISRGTEALVFRGRVPPSEHERMRAPFQAGDFPAPVKYGYASVGVVEHGPAGPARARTCSRSTRIRRATSCRPRPCIVCPTACRRRARCWPPTSRRRSTVCGTRDPRIGDRVAVVGAGTVGCLVAWLAGRIPGCDVELVDVNPRASGGGRRARCPVRDARGGRRERGCRGARERLAGRPRARRCASPAFEATIVELSWYGDQAVSLPLGQAFHARRLTLKSSQVGSVAPSQRARWDFAAPDGSSRWRSLADPALDVLITGESDVRRAAAGDGGAGRRHARRALPPHALLNRTRIR